MILWWRAAWAMASLTVCEIARQKTWLALLAAIGVMLITLANLDAVDPAAHLKLSISTISGSINFVCTLFAILLVASTITRDREQLVSLTLFPKPLPKSAYVWGRWLGVQICLALAVVILNCVGVAVVHMSAQQTVPGMRSIQPAADWEKVDYYGDVTTVDDERATLSGHRSGNALRWRFKQVPEQAQQLLIKGQVRAVDPAHKQAQISVFLLDPENPEQRTRLSLHTNSPYGQFVSDGALAEQGKMMMVHKNRRHVDLNQDYLRIDIPSGVVEGLSAFLIELVREDSKTSLTFSRSDSCLLAIPGGSFFTNMQRAGVVVLAQVAYLNAVALLCACFSNIGVTLFAGLTTFFAALMLSYIESVAPSSSIPPFIARSIDLLQAIIPDFNRFGVESLMAGGRSISWNVAAAAWSYYGLYTCAFMVMAWWVMARREL